MRNTLILVGLLLASRLFAQDSSKFVIFINPYFTNDKNNNVYEITNVNSNESIPGYPKIEEKIQTSYYNVGLDMKSYVTLRKDFLAIFQVGFGYDRYYSYLPYKTLESSNTWVSREKIEEINGLRLNLHYGAGKVFSLDKQKKLNLVLEGLLYFNASSFNKKLSYNEVGKVNPSTREYNGSNLNVGVKCNLAINYQIYKRLGIGLALNDLINAYASKIYRSETFYIDETETIVKIAQLSSPVFSLVFFL